jgi:hypothetical protein
MPLAILMVVALSQPAAPRPSSIVQPPPERPPVGSATYMYFWPYAERRLMRTAHRRSRAPDDAYARE